MPDPVIVAALAYESAALAAFHALDDADPAAQGLALQRFSAAVAGYQSLPAADRDRALAHLARREKIPQHAWDLIAAALRRQWAAETVSVSPGRMDEPGGA